MVANSIVLNPQHQIEALKSVMEIMQRIYADKTILRPDMDYGVIPGTAKPTLLQPGAEKLMRVFRLCPRLTELQAEIDFNNNWILYRYRAEIIEIDTDAVIGYAIGSCNSFEEKYRWRWVDEHKVPSNLNKSELEYRTSSAKEFEFAYKKRETSGKYGKPESYWQQFDEAISNGTVKNEQGETSRGKSPMYVIESRSYRIPNPQIFDQLNTIDKMAQKRALVSAVKAAVGASEYFTVDIEDMPEFSDFMPAAATPITVEPIEKTNRVEDDAHEAEIITGDDGNTEFFRNESNVTMWLAALHSTHKIGNELLPAFRARVLECLNTAHNSGFDRMTSFGGIYTEKEATEIVKKCLNESRVDASKPVDNPKAPETNGTSAMKPNPNPFSKTGQSEKSKAISNDDSDDAPGK